MDFSGLWYKGKKHYDSKHYLRTKIYRIVLRICFNNDIPFQIDVGDGVHFNHNGFGIVINPNVHIGEGTDIQHGVTIGEIEKGKAPIIGKNVYIGAKATILGNIRIGDNVKIGACTLVLNDIPSNCTVVGVPGHVIVHDK